MLPAVGGIVLNAGNGDRSRGRRHREGGVGGVSRIVVDIGRDTIGHDDIEVEIIAREARIVGSIAVKVDVANLAHAGIADAAENRVGGIATSADEAREELVGRPIVLLGPGRKVVASKHAFAVKCIGRVRHWLLVDVNDKAHQVVAGEGGDVGKGLDGETLLAIAERGHLSRSKIDHVVADRNSRLRVIVAGGDDEVGDVGVVLNLGLAHPDDELVGAGRRGRGVVLVHEVRRELNEGVDEQPRTDRLRSEVAGRSRVVATVNRAIDGVGDVRLEVEHMVGTIGPQNDVTAEVIGSTIEPIGSCGWGLGISARIRLTGNESSDREARKIGTINMRRIGPCTKSARDNGKHCQHFFDHL